MRTIATDRPRISGWCSAGQHRPSDITTGCRTPETCRCWCHDDEKDAN